MIQKHTFYEAVNENPVIIQLCSKLTEFRHKAFEKVDQVKESQFRWDKKDRKPELFDQKKKMNIDKMIDKNPSTKVIESHML